MKKLQILIPQYKETEDVVATLLNSIQSQINIDFNDIGVIIVNDCSDVILTENLFNRYTFDIEYFQNEENKGVSATRNACLARATADYVMFCDADDAFIANDAFQDIIRILYKIPQKDKKPIDYLNTAFLEELPRKNKETNKILDYIYVPHEKDGTFVHGKIVRRQFLIDCDIKWRDELKVHEDSYFWALCSTFSENTQQTKKPLYIWKWRDESVSRHDDLYIFRTYKNFVNSNYFLVKELLTRGKRKSARIYAYSALLKAYAEMNLGRWLDPTKKEYKMNTELRLGFMYLEYKDLIDELTEQQKKEINRLLTNTFINKRNDGTMPVITFNNWLQYITMLAQAQIKKQ